MVFGIKITRQHGWPQSILRSGLKNLIRNSRTQSNMLPWPLIISWATRSHMSPPTLSSSILSPTSPLMSSLSVLELFKVWRHTITRPPSVFVQLIWMKQGSWIFTRSIYWRLYWWWDRHGMQSLQRQLPIVGDMPVLQSKSTEPTRWSYLNWKLLQNPLRAHFRIKLNHHTWCSSFTCSRSGSMGHHWRVCIRNYWYISWGWRKIGGIFGYQLQILQLARGLQGDWFCRRQHCCCNQLDQDALIQSPQSYYPTLSIIQLPIHLSYPTAPSTPTRSPWKCDHGGNFSVAKKGTHSRHTPHIGGDIESNWRRFCGQNRIWVPRWQSVLAWNGCALSMCHLTLMLLAYRVRYKNFELTSVTLTMSLMFKLPSNSFGPRLTQMRIFPCCK